MGISATIPIVDLLLNWAKHRTEKQAYTWDYLLIYPHAYMCNAVNYIHTPHLNEHFKNCRIFLTSLMWASDAQGMWM